MINFSSNVKSERVLVVDGSLESCLQVAQAFYDVYQGFVDDRELRETAGYLYIPGALDPINYDGRRTAADLRVLSDLKRFLGHVYGSRERGIKSFFFCNLNTGRSCVLLNHFRFEAKR